MSELINFFKLSATFDPTTNSTREVVQTSDRAQFRRQITVVKKWTRLAELGHGAGGVWLEYEEANKESRAVKQIPKGTPSTPFRGNPKRELLALSRLSKVSIGNVSTDPWRAADPLIAPRSLCTFSWVV